MTTVARNELQKWIVQLPNLVKLLKSNVPSDRCVSPKRFLPKDEWDRFRGTFISRKATLGVGNTAILDKHICGKTSGIFCKFRPRPNPKNPHFTVENTQRVAGSGRSNNRIVPQTQKQLTRNSYGMKTRMHSKKFP